MRLLLFIIFPILSFGQTSGSGAGFQTYPPYSPSSETFTVVNTYTVSATSGNVVINATVGAGNLIVIACGYYTGITNAMNISDNEGNAYYGGCGQLTSSGDSTLPQVTTSVATKIYTLYNPKRTVSNTLAISLKNTSLFSAVAIVFESTTYPICRDALSPNATSPSSTQTVSGTASFANELLFAATTIGTISTTVTATSGWTVVQVPFSSGVNEGIAVAYKLSGSSGSNSVTFTGTAVSLYNYIFLGFF